MAIQNLLVYEGLTVGNSVIATNGAFVGINNSNPTVALHVTGDSTVSGNVLVGSTVNAASHTVGSSTIANSTGIYTGVVNGATLSVGTAVVANSSRLTVGSAVGLAANGGIGTAGQVLHSNGTTIYWDTDDQGVTSVSSGNGLTGGPITTTGTLSVQANNGIIANATGVYVDSTYIGTLTANNSTYAFGKSESALNVNSALTSNNSSYLGGTIASGYQTTAGLSANVATLSANNTTYLNGQLASYYTNATNITTGTLPWAQAPTGTVNTSGAFTFTGVETFNANVVLGSGLSANGSYGTATHVLHSNGTATYWAADDQGVTSVASGNGLTGGPITTTGTLSVQANSGIVANSTGVFVNAGTGIVSNSIGVHVNSAYIATISANNTTYLNGQLASYYTNATNITTGTLAWSQAPTGTVNTSGAFTFTGVETFNANVVLGSGLSANGTYGSAGQVLKSNGTATYWDAAAASIGGANTQIIFNDSGSANGTSGFTFIKTSNTVFVANTLGIGNSAPTVKFYVNGSAAGAVGTLSDGANIAVDLSTFNNFTVTLNGARNLDNPTNLVVGQSGVIWVSQNTTGGQTLSFGSFWKFPGNTAPTLSTAASAVDAIAYVVRTTSSITAQSILNVG